MHKEIIKEFLNFGLLKVVYFSNNHDLNYPGHLFLHFFPWFQLNIVNCHPGWLSNLCLIWMWRFRPTFKNLILHHLEISRGPPLVISSSWKFTGDSTAPTPGIFQDLKIFRAWKFPWAVNEIVLKKIWSLQKNFTLVQWLHSIMKNENCDYWPKVNHGFDPVWSNTKHSGNGRKSWTFWKWAQI